MPIDLSNDLRERAFRFTCKLFDYCDDLARNPGPSRRLANQLFDAGSSIGANLAESKAAYSRKELAAKNAISLKESKELREWLLQESDEFVAMLTVSVRRLQTEPDPRDQRR
jgi:four helix bundle protein